MRALNRFVNVPLVAPILARSASEGAPAVRVQPRGANGPLPESPGGGPGGPHTRAPNKRPTRRPRAVRAHPPGANGP